MAAKKTARKRAKTKVKASRKAARAGRTAKSCSGCGESGHNVRTCPGPKRARKTR